MKAGKRRLLINWSDTHYDLKRSIENNEPYDYDREIENNKGWSYMTFFSKETQANKILFDIDRLMEMAKDNNYYLPREVIVQHNKVVVTAYPDGESPASPLLGLYLLVSSYMNRYSNTHKYPSHGFYGKFGGIYERPEKGRVLAIYTGNDDALLHIYESIEKLIPEAPLKGVRFDLHFSNGLSAIPRMLHGFDDPDYSLSGARHYKITDPHQFTVLLNQAKYDYTRYPFDKWDARVDSQ